MQRRHDDGKRPRIGVSLDPEVYEWIKDFNGPSDSYTVSRILRAAMLAGLTLEEAKAAGVLEEFSEWLGRRRKNQLAADLHALLSQYLSEK
jgi:hypothetical protein